MLKRHLALPLLAIAFALGPLAAPVMGPFGQAAFAGPGGGAGAGGPGGPDGGPGAAGAGTAGAQGAQGAATSAVATDHSTKGVEHAQAVVGTTPASEQASQSLGAAAEKQSAGEEASEDESDMSFSEAMEHMAEDAQAAMNAIFGRSE